jgi:hypothetical protein
MHVAITGNCEFNLLGRLSWNEPPEQVVIPTTVSTDLPIAEKKCSCVFTFFMGVASSNLLILTSNVIYWS